MRGEGRRERPGTPLTEAVQRFGVRRSISARKVHARARARLCRFSLVQPIIHIKCEKMCHKMCTCACQHIQDTCGDVVFGALPPHMYQPATTCTL